MSDKKTFANGGTESFNLQSGEEVLLDFATPAEFEIETASGTRIKGVLTPNNPMAITNGGDLTKFEINIIQRNEIQEIK